MDANMGAVVESRVAVGSETKVVGSMGISDSAVGAGMILAAGANIEVGAETEMVAVVSMQWAWI